MSIKLASLELSIGPFQQRSVRPRKQRMENETPQNLMVLIPGGKREKNSLSGRPIKMKNNNIWKLRCTSWYFLQFQLISDGTGSHGEIVAEPSSLRYYKSYLLTSQSIVLQTLIFFVGHVLVHHHSCISQHLCACHWALQTTWMARSLPGDHQPLLRGALYSWNVPQNVCPGLSRILCFSVQSVRFFCCPKQPSRVNPHTRKLDASVGSFCASMCSTSPNI